MKQRITESFFLRKPVLKTGCTIIFLIIAMICASCGGSSGSSAEESSTRASLIDGFEGIGSLEKQEDKSWRIQWKPVVADEIIYAIYKTEEPEPFNFNQALVTVSGASIYDFKPENIFTTSVICFVVRIAGSTDQNEKKLCTTPEPLEFKGLEIIEQQSDGGFILQWSNIDLEGTFFSVYSKFKEGEYNFDQPSFAAITLNYHKIEAVERGTEECYIVRYSNNVLPPDENTAELCTGPSTVIDFKGIEKIETSEQDPSWRPQVLK